MRFFGKAVLFLIGLVLLLPGACSLGFLALGVPLLPSVFKTPLSADVVTIYGFYLGIWGSGLVLGALGVWLIVRTVRSSNGR